MPNPDLRPMRIAGQEVGFRTQILQKPSDHDVRHTEKYHRPDCQAQISDDSGFIDTRINSGKSQTRA